MMLLCCLEGLLLVTPKNYRSLPINDHDEDTKDHDAQKVVEKQPNNKTLMELTGLTWFKNPAFVVLCISKAFKNVSKCFNHH